MTAAQRRVLTVVALVHRVDERVLLVRSARHTAFYFPGGKIDPGETALGALHREVREELGASLVAGTERSLGCYRAPAYGEGADVDVDLHCFTAELSGIPVAANEIAELAWMTPLEYRALSDTAPAVLAVFGGLEG